MMDVHVGLGSITFESSRVQGECRLNECFLSRNLFRIDGPLVYNTDYQHENHHDGQVWHDEEEEEEQETSKHAAIMRYDQFRMVYGDLLDSSLEEEFQTMRQMGLPTMLINSYGDMEYDDDDDDNNDGCDLFSHCQRQHHQAGHSHRKSHHTHGHSNSRHRYQQPSQKTVDPPTPGVVVVADDMADNLLCEKDENESKGDDDDNDVEKKEEEEGMLCPRESSDSFADSSLLNREQHDVDWEEVVRGEAAGMPGQWIPVVQDHTSTTATTEDLLSALHVKAQAFADDDWQQYWSTTGPSHLAHSWTQSYPSIPLNKVENVSGVDFLCQAMQTQMILTSDTIAAEEENMVTVEEPSTTVDGCESAVTGDNENSHEKEKGEESKSVEISDFEILSMWNKFYNNHYWHMYSWYRGDCDELLPVDTTIVEEEEKEETLAESFNGQDMSSQGPINSSDHCNSKSDTSFSARTLEKCLSMGFSVTEKEECNPHRRWVRVAAVKLLQSAARRSNWPGRHRLMEEALSSVGRDGRLLVKRKKKKNKKRKGKNASTPTDAVPVVKQCADTQSHNISHEEKESEGEESQERDREEEMEEEEKEEEEEEEKEDCDKMEEENDAKGFAVSLSDMAGKPFHLSSLLPPPLSSAPPNLAKYWSQRFRIFSKYDDGIRMDNEGWFSATPEKIAAHIAERCQCDLIVDAFCGVGSNAIQFAFTCERVIAIDIDPVKVACARHNAELYGVADRIEFIVGDYFNVLPHMKCVDVVFLSPPWGGPSYTTSSIFSLHSMTPLDGLQVFQVAREVTPHIAYYLPRNIDITELVSAVSSEESIEVEQHFLNKKFKTVTAYFGELVEQQ